ncbi:hypothetical protein CVT24_000699 [Panaeolus cyanescens]|uniref:NAD(P)-binding protein n=1 Tax=Panaeolus cyanescens TaxID=181874 RepID=A0A409WBG4_9AGAR|nr:hypothetical protein CVT24_000699 [Panaeolus cyanescens]
MSNSESSRTEPLVWLITGTSSGFGRYFVTEALGRGDKVIATARAKSIHQLDDLKAKGAQVLELDVTAPTDTLKEVAKKAVEIYGRIDVLVNNAGYVQAGTVEEVTAEEAYRQYQTNVLGPMDLTRAVLPYMRERRTGTIVFIGSLAGHIGVGYMGLYNSTKWALRGIALSLNQEISHLGLRATCIDFGTFRTAVLDPSKRGEEVARIPDYKPVSDMIEAHLKAENGKQAGDPEKGVRVVVDIVRGEGSALGKPFPASVCIGSDCYGGVKAVAEGILRNLEEWKEVTCSTNFDDI